MGYAKHVGRVGALAVALGIGAAVATTPGVAWADGETETNVEAPSTPTPPGGEGAAGTTTPSTGHRDPGEVIRRNVERAADDLRDGIRKAISGVVRSSGGAITSTHRNGSNSTNGNVPPVIVEGEDEPIDNPEPKDELKSTTLVANNSAATNPVRSFTPPRWRAPQAQIGSNTAPKPLAKAIDDVKDVVQQSINAVTANQSPTGSTDVQRNAFSTLDTSQTEEQQQVRTGFVAPVAIVTNVLNAALAPFLNPTPGQPTPQNPVLWAVLGWVRRQVQDSPFGKVVLNRTPRVDVETTQVVDNGDGTFTITPSASDPDGDDLTYTVTASGDGEGTITPGPGGTYTYTVTDSDWDERDTVTITASDAADYTHAHGPFGFFRPSGGHTDTITVAIAPDDGSLPPPPEVVKSPAERNDGSGNFDTELQYNPDTTANVSAAPGFPPKYWTVVSESYDPITGKYTAVLKPTQAGQLRSALGLDTTDQLKLNVTGQQQIAQTFALRAIDGDEQFGALAADDPDQALNLPDIPAGHFATLDPIVTSPDAEDPTQTFPAGTVVTGRYAYVLNSQLSSGNSSTLSVIGADPEKADYLQLVDEIDLGASGLLLTQAGDRLYISTGDTVQVVDTDGADPLVESDDNELLAPIELGEQGGAIPVASPDGKTLYVINQQLRKIYVIDTDPANTATYHTVTDEIIAADAPTVVNNGDGTTSISGQFPLSLTFNGDGTRMYLVRDGQAYTQNTSPPGITDFTFSGEIVTIDIDPTSATYNEIIGTPVPLQGDYGYFASSDGKYLYVPALNMNGFDPTVDTDITIITGGINVIDVQDPDNPVIVANLPTGTLPVNVAFSPDKSLAYVVDAGSGTVYVIDTVNQEVLDLDSVAAGNQGLVFDADPSATLGQVFNVIASSPDGSRLFVTNFGKGTVVPLEFVQDVV